MQSAQTNCAAFNDAAIAFFRKQGWYGWMKPMSAPVKA
jgi:hypothetical protein